MGGAFATQRAAAAPPCANLKCSNREGRRCAERDAEMTEEGDWRKGRRETDTARAGFRGGGGAAAAAARRLAAALPRRSKPFGAPRARRGGGGGGGGGGAGAGAARRGRRKKKVRS